MSTEMSGWREVNAPPSPLERLRERREEPYPCLLESALTSPDLGRYSYLAAEPFLIFRSKGKNLTIRTAVENRTLEGDPLEAVASLLREYRLPDLSSPVPFGPAAIGYLGYDLNRLLERLPSLASDDLLLPDIHLAFYDRVEVWDHHEGRAFRFRSETVRPPVEPEPPDDFGSRPSGVRSNFTREAYLDAIRTVKRAIEEGEIYQANLSQRFQVATTSSPIDLYARLRESTAAPFACYIDAGPFQVIGASPERFLKVRGRKVETRPIKGTRRRGRSSAEDDRLSRDLLESEKDAAELAMIVDVERNDLGRVAEYGTVQVTERKVLRKWPTVFHLEATVEATLRQECGVMDLIRASFPGGSITGAPKIRAMEILEGIEPTRRGVYTGAVGAFGLDGDCDLNIAIRTLVLKDGVASFQAGGGIVADSDPEAEYQETLDKARALFEALEITEGALP